MSHTASASPDDNARHHHPAHKMDVSEIYRLHGREALLRMRDSVQPMQFDSPAPQQERDSRISFLGPVELSEFVPNPDIALVGDCHIMRGSPFLVGGDAGVGKSRGITDLAVAGALGPDGPGWFGLPIHRRFRTMIIQTENGRHRLQKEYCLRPCAELQGWVLVSEPPPFGLTLAHPEFRQDMKAAMDAFKPDCVILDPWNAAAKDDKQRDYSEAFDALLSILPLGDARPALGIVAHTRKPQPNEKRVGGTGLKNILAGSHVLTSVPRCVFVMIRASEEENDDRVVFCNPKNNDGALVQRTAWQRTAAGYLPVEDFDWEEFENGGKVGNPNGIKLADLSEIFEDGAKTMELAAAAQALATHCNMSVRSAYNALSERGAFAGHLAREGKTISFKS